MKKKIICFDIDGVLCSTKKNFYKKSKPKKKNILVVNNLYNKGFYIKIFTSRFMGRSNENIIAAKKKAGLLTKKQLKKWGVKYNKLIFGKPSFDLYIDDKSLNFDKNWSANIKILLSKNF
jgi:FMN phosphatase YigB (HAD superfamily)